MRGLNVLPNAKVPDFEPIKDLSTLDTMKPYGVNAVRQGFHALFSVSAICSLSVHSCYSTAVRHAQYALLFSLPSSLACWELSQSQRSACHSNLLSMALRGPFPALAELFVESARGADAVVSYAA